VDKEEVMLDYINIPSLYFTNLTHKQRNAFTQNGYFFALFDILILFNISTSFYYTYCKQAFANKIKYLKIRHLTTKNSNKKGRNLKSFLPFYLITIFQSSFDQT